MADFLSRMADASQARVPRLAEARARAVDAAPVLPLRTDRFGLIAEIKARSPSQGRLAEVDVASRARAYERGGAAMLSVLTEPTAFGGSLEHLRQAVAAVDLPVMRKDFLIAPAQVAEARTCGASSVLLITRLLGDRLPALLDEADRCGLRCLVECFDEADVERTSQHLRPGVLVGVNTRDLATLQVRPERLAALAPRLPAVPTVAESGILCPQDAAAAAALGYRFALVGTALMRAADPAAAVAALVAAGSRRRPVLKICGLTHEDDVAACVSAGVDMVGFVLASSPRQVTAERAAVLARGLPAGVESVLVFHRATTAELAQACAVARPDLVQSEPVDRFGQPVRVPPGVTFLPVVHDGEEAPSGEGLLLLDSAGRGGRGVPCAPDGAAALAARRPLMLAGGLRPDTVAAAIAAVRPVGVDVSSGVECSPGRKDAALIHAFVAAARTSPVLEPLS